MASPTDPPALAKDPTSPRIEAVKKQLHDLVAKQYPAGAKIKTWAHRGPLDLVEVTAALEGAYPGSGVARVLIDDPGVTYGIHGDKDFADLCRARGWLGTAALPDAHTLLKIVDTTNFEGVAMWLEKPAPKAERKGGSLVLTLHRTWMPSGGDTLVIITVSASGKAQIESK